MLFAKVKKDETGHFRLIHVGIELPGRYATFRAAELAFTLPDEKLLDLERESWQRSGRYHGVVTHQDVARSCL